MPPAVAVSLTAAFLLSCTVSHRKGGFPKHSSFELGFSNSSLIDPNLIRVGVEWFMSERFVQSQTHYRWPGDPVVCYLPVKSQNRSFEERFVTQQGDAFPTPGRCD